MHLRLHVLLDHLHSLLHCGLGLSHDLLELGRLRKLVRVEPNDDVVVVNSLGHLKLIESLDLGHLGGLADMALGHLTHLGGNHNTCLGSSLLNLN